MDTQSYLQKKSRPMQMFAALLIILALGSSAVLQTLALTSLKKSGISNEEIKSASNYLLVTLIFNYIMTAILLFLVIFVMVKKPTKEAYQKEDTLGKTLTFSIIAGGVLVFVSGIMSSLTATNLQCYKEQDEHIMKSWMYSTYSSIVGVLTAFFVLILQAYVNKRKLKKILKSLLVTQEAKSLGRAPARPTYAGYGTQPRQVRQSRPAEIPRRQFARRPVQLQDI